MPSVLWRCWLGGRKGIQPVKNWVVGCWRDYPERGADLHTAQLMLLLLIVSCFNKIQIGFTFLVPAHLGSPGKRAVKRLCVYDYNYLMSCDWESKQTVVLASAFGRVDSMIWLQQNPPVSLTVSLTRGAGWRMPCYDCKMIVVVVVVVGTLLC